MLALLPNPWIVLKERSNAMRKSFPLSALTKSPKVEARISNIRYVGADAVSIENSFPLGWIERGSTQNAIVIRFRTGELYSQTKRVCLNAMLTYKDELTEIANIMGYWREVKSGDGYSEGDCRRTLIAGMLLDGGIHRLRGAPHESWRL
jgi:hypothetical protein